MSIQNGMSKGILNIIQINIIVRQTLDQLLYLLEQLIVYQLKNFQQQHTQEEVLIKLDQQVIVHKLLNLCTQHLSFSFIRVKQNENYLNKLILNITINVGRKIQDQVYMILKKQNKRILMQAVKIKFFNLKYQTAKKFQLKMQIQVLVTMKQLNQLKKRQKNNKRKVQMDNLLDLNLNHS